jgi:uncharacterized repeat protein (TIGR02543 family)
MVPKKEYFMVFNLTVKKAALAAVCVLTVLALSGCFNPWDGNTGTITINLGDSAGGSRAVHEWPPNNEMLKDIKYSITLSGKSGTIHLDAEGGAIIKTTLAAGIWNITISAFLNGELYAEGSAVAEVKAGQAASVTIPLRYAGEEPSEETFTVTFYSNEGSPVDAETVVKGGTATRPANPARNGYGFVRWCSDETLNTEYDFTAPVTEDITLYALWSAVTYTVTFNSNDGSPVNTAVVGEGGTATRPANPARNDYVFEDWYSDANFTTKYDFDTPVYGNIVLYARWIQQFTVTFDSNGGTSVTSQTINQGSTVERPANPTRNGYGFVLWCSDSGLNVEYDFETPVYGDITLYAKWSAVTYTVTFNSNDGSPVDTAVVGEGGTATRPANPTRNGYVFIDWYSDSSLNTLYNFNTLVYGDIVLYARWISLPLTSVNDIVPYLAVQTEGNGITNPIDLPITIDLGTMTQEDSGWRQILDALETAGKYVNLDISACTMTGTEFNPDYNIATGKDKIVEIALPDAAKSIVAGSSSNSTFKNFSILKTFSGTELTTIGNYAFTSCTNLTITELPTRITYIGNQAFYGCTNLALTELPSGITYLGEYAFMNCMNLALTSLPEGLTSISLAAFRNCTSLALTSLPTNLTFITNNAFNNCTNLAITSLPAGLTSIENRTFTNCTNLAINALPEGIATIGENAFENCTSLALSSLPTGLTSISNSAFYGCTSLGLTSLPTGLTSINDTAFSGCISLALTSLPAGITSIGNGAFFNCATLNLTTLPTGVTSIGQQAFGNCTNLALTSLPAGITSIDYYAFGNCTSLDQITLPTGLTSINGTTFYGCTSLVEITCLAATPPTLGTGAFNNTASNLEIKVPAASVNAYKAAAGWSDYADKIIGF